MFVSCVFDPDQTNRCSYVSSNTAVWLLKQRDCYKNTLWSDLSFSSDFICVFCFFLWCLSLSFSLHTCTPASPSLAQPSCRSSSPSHDPHLCLSTCLCCVVPFLIFCSVYLSLHLWFILNKRLLSPVFPPCLLSLWHNLMWLIKAALCRFGG